ncbi:MAG: serine/threonine-protein kinase, partial [Myxococcaceae bacterium]
MPCPPETAILDFAQGALSRAEAEALHGHLDSCETCQRLVGEAARTSQARPRQAAPPPLPRGSTVDRYLILEELGVGGMGVVYAAFDPQLDRKIALKLLRADLSANAERRIRLLGEAQALARVSNPHVVTVYEAKAIGDQVFVTMELIEGRTLGQWLRAEQRPWREVLDVFLKAGEGLRAAHEGGVVHRDFKPDNVLLGQEGRVFVTDFGLARRFDANVAVDAGLVEGLTRSGEALGTPAYMAPEQWAGEETTAASDQFSFCVALHEGLYGERPFAGSRTTQLREAVARGELKPVRKDSHVPAWLRRVLLQGLAVSPSKRHPSMGALLQALRHDPLKVWRKPIAVFTAASLIAIGIVIGATRSTQPPCQGAEQRLAGIWDAERKQQVTNALRSSSSTAAEGAARGVERALNAYAAQWVTQHQDACEATRVRGDQSEAMLDLRMNCLAHRARDLQALTELFVRRRGEEVELAVQAAYSLPPLKECAETETLAAQVK